MKRTGLKKAMAVAGTLVLVLVASLSYADQYEAISTDSRSLKYTNTFGNFYNDYDFLVNPRLLGHTKGKRVVTNLTNLDDQNEFQLGYGGPLGPGNIAGIVSVGGEGDEESYSESEVMFMDSNEDDVDDVKIENNITYREDEWNESNLDGYLGYGYALNNNIGVGAGVGYNRYTTEESYWDIYNYWGLPMLDPRRGPMYIRTLIDTPYMDLDDFQLSFDDFDSSLISEEIIMTDMDTGEVIARADESLDGTMKETNNEIDLLLGADTKVGNKLTASADVIIGFGSEKMEGDGTFAANVEMSEGAIWEQNLASSLSETYNSIRRYGIAVEGQYAVNPKHLAHVNLGFEQSPGKIKESEYTAVYNERQENLVSGEIFTDNETYRGERSGNVDKTTSLMITIWDNYTVSDIISLGFGGEFGWGKITDDYTDSATYSGVETNDDNGIYGDDYEDDWTETESANMSREITAEGNYMVFAFPVTAIVKVTGKLELRLGARYSHIRYDSEFTDNMTSYEGLTWSREYSDGYVEEELTPEPNQTFSYIAKKEEIDYVESIGDIRVGLGYDPSENFELEVLFISEDEIDEGDVFAPFSLDAGNYEGSLLLAAYLSGTIKFK